MLSLRYFYEVRPYDPECDSAFYRNRYTVYRPEDPHVVYMRRPTDYPPYDHTIRENPHWADPDSYY